MRRLLLLWGCCILLSSTTAGADTRMDHVLEQALSLLPAPAAVWKETYRDPLYPLDAGYAAFSVVRVESGNDVDYALVQSRLSAIDLRERAVSCYFILLPDAAQWPCVVVPASGSPVAYTPSAPPRLSAAEIRERLHDAEQLAARSAELQPLPCLQFAGGAFEFAGALALFQFVFRPLVSGGIEDPDGDRTMGSSCAGLGVIGAVCALGAVGELGEMSRIRSRLLGLWN
jgi:hypothetical protein